MPRPAPRGVGCWENKPLLAAHHQWLTDKRAQHCVKRRCQWSHSLVQALNTHPDNTLQSDIAAYKLQLEMHLWAQRWAAS